MIIMTKSYCYQSPRVFKWHREWQSGQRDWQRNREEKNI